MSGEGTDWSQYEAVVERRWEYYRPRFQRFERGEWLSWNWAVFFGTLAWLRYRRLHAWSWAYLLVCTPVLVAVYFIATSDACATALRPSPIPSVLLGLAFLGWLLAPLLADRIYFSHVRAIVRRKAPEGARTVGSYWGALSLQTFLVLLTAVALPSYGAYLPRARIAEGVAAISALKSPLAEYLADKGRLPARIDEISGGSPSRYVRAISLAKDGTLRAEFSDAYPLLRGRSVKLSPKIEGTRVLEWRCASDDLPPVCLPTACRP
jgi:hypothetical protein